MVPYPRPRRRGRGCLWGCLAIVLVAVMLVGGAGLWLWLVPPKSKNLALGHKESLVQSTVSASGGTVFVQQPGHALDGLRIDVPGGTYAQDTAFKVSARPIEEHRFGADFTPITPLIHVDNGHGFAAEPMTLEIPIQLAEGEFALAFFYDQVTGKLEGLPLVSLTRDKITVLTAHFSDIVVSKVDGARLEDLVVDTGFRPGVDDWQFPNRGSIVAPKGHCAGQSISAMWYYVEQRKAQGAPPLSGNYDNNNLHPATPTLWQDDAWGYRFASSVQRSIDWSPWSAKISRYLGGVNDTLTLSAFAYAMLITGEPQYVSIGRYEAVDDKSIRYGHALVAYKIENGRIYVADPNYAGQEGRVIPFASGAFRPYASGDNVDEIEVAGPKDYTEIRCMAKSALVDWARIGELYQDMLRDEAGKGIFPAYTLKVFTGLDENGDEIWVTAPRVLEIGEDQTAQAGEELRGKLLVKIEMAADTEMRLQALRGTRALFDPVDIAGSADGKIKLEPGVNDLGFYIQVKDPKYGNYKFEDFWRVKVIYGPVDLTGTWEGVWQVQDAGKILRYVEDLLVRFLLWTTLAKDEQTAREAAAASMEVDASLYAERPFRIVFDAPDPTTPNHYPIHVTTLNDDGTTEEMSGEAIYDQGEVRFAVRHSDGSKLECEGLLTGNTQLDGEFAIHAWGGVVQDAALGRWQVTKQ